MTEKKEGIFINIPNVKDTNPDHDRDEYFVNKAYSYNEHGEKEYMDFYNVTLPADTIVDGKDISYGKFTVPAKLVDINNQYADKTHSILFTPATKDFTFKNGYEVKQGEYAPIFVEKDDKVFGVSPQALKEAEIERYERFKASKAQNKKKSKESLQDRTEKASKSSQKSKEAGKEANSRNEIDLI